MKTVRTCAVVLCLALLGAIVPATNAASALASETGTYYPLTATRLLDTRNGTGAARAPLGAGQTLSLQVSGRGSVPTSGVAAVVLNLTVTGGTANSVLTAFPSGQARPGVSSINFRANTTRANGLTVKLGTGGKIDIYNFSGSVSVIADVVGYYASSTITTTTGTEFDTYGPDRLDDTRTSSLGALGAQQILSLYVDFDGGAANRYVKALAVNVTAVHGTASGHLDLYDGGPNLPTTSTLNYAGAGAVANLATVKTSLCTECSDPDPVQFAVYNNSSGSVHVIVDLVGIYYNDGTVGLRFHPLAPVRVSDSRKTFNGSPLSAGQTQTLTAPTTVATTSTVALVSNLTAIAPTTSTYLSVWQGSTLRPGVSNINASAGSTVANGAIIPLDEARKFNIYNSSGTTNFALDVAGRFDVGTTAQVSASHVGRFTDGLNTRTRRQSVPSSR